MVNIHTQAAERKLASYTVHVKYILSSKARKKINRKYIEQKNVRFGAFGKFDLEYLHNIVIIMLSKYIYIYVIL